MASNQPGASSPPITFRPGRTYRVVPTRANGSQPAFGMYLASGPPRRSVYRAYSLLVITTMPSDHITDITGFSTNVMTRFGLPRTLPETD